MIDTPPGDCPLCGTSLRDRTAVRRHLLVEHRKSEVATGLLDALDAGERRRVAVEE